jgi:hypothetical protein
MISSRLRLVAFLACIAVLFTSGCLMKRTVTRDGAVVEEGYVVKGPLRAIP